MFCLFANKSDPKELFEELQEIIKNRENNFNNNNNNNNNNSNGNNALDDESDDLLNLEFERLREIERAIIQKVIEEFTTQLVDLWDKCLVSQYEFMFAIILRK
ncbi:hypothetical protein Glove_574g15 [Diversispora epigaea]|uniref:Uncharacterized protein n=1 Tax=Diversispora epigaea TaxID=1348612 RepID=A0A397GB41_9GLOM|nr:hypothetical protein Glove_574g15 [Diversispora epigaea]